MLSLGSVFKLGSGVRSLNQTVLPNLAIVESAANVLESAPFVNVQVIALKEEKSLHSALGFSMDTLGSSVIPSSVGEIDLSVSAKAKFAQQVTMDKQHIYFMIKKSVTSTKSLTNNILMTEAAVQTVVDQEDISGFYTLYGDKYITQMTTGSEIIVVLQMDSTVNGKSSSYSESTEITTNVLKTSLGNAATSQGDNESFKGISDTSCWVYLTGVSNARTFTLAMNDLGSMLTSIAQLFKTADEIDEVILSCKTASYSLAQIPSAAIKPNQMIKSQVNQRGLTDKLISLDKYVRDVKELWDKNSDTQRLLNAYLQKYDALWVIMHKEYDRYKNDLAECENNRDLLKTIKQKLVKMADEIVTNAILDKKTLAQYTNALHGMEFKLEFINGDAVSRKTLKEHTLYIYDRNNKNDYEFSMINFDDEVLENIDFQEFNTKFDQKKYISEILDRTEIKSEDFPTTVWINGYKNEVDLMVERYSDIRQKTFKLLKKLTYNKRLGHQNYFTTAFATGSKRLFFKTNKLQNLFVMLENDNVNQLPLDINSGFILKVENSETANLIIIKHDQNLRHKILTTFHWNQDLANEKNIIKKIPPNFISGYVLVDKRDSHEVARSTSSAIVNPNKYDLYVYDKTNKSQQLIKKPVPPTEITDDTDKNKAENDMTQAIDALNNASMSIETVTKRHKDATDRADLLKKIAKTKLDNLVTLENKFTATEANKVTLNKLFEITKVAHENLEIKLSEAKSEEKNTRIIAKKTDSRVESIKRNLKNSQNQLYNKRNESLKLAAALEEKETEYKQLEKDLQDAKYTFDNALNKSTIVNQGLAEAEGELHAAKYADENADFQLEKAKSLYDEMKKNVAIASKAYEVKVEMLENFARESLNANERKTILAEKNDEIITAKLNESTEREKLNAASNILFSAHKEKIITQTSLIKANTNFEKTKPESIRIVGIVTDAKNDYEDIRSKYFLAKKDFSAIKNEAAAADHEEKYLSEILFDVEKNFKSAEKEKNNAYFAVDKSTELVMEIQIQCTATKDKCTRVENELINASPMNAELGMQCKQAMIEKNEAEENVKTANENINAEFESIKIANEVFNKKNQQLKEARKALDKANSAFIIEHQKHASITNYHSKVNQWINWAGEIHLANEDVRNIQFMTGYIFDKYKLYSFDKVNGSHSVQLRIASTHKTNFEKMAEVWSVRGDGRAIQLSENDCENIALWAESTQLTHDNSSFEITKVNYAPSDPLKCLPTGHTYSHASPHLKGSGSYTNNFFIPGQRYILNPSSKKYEVDVYEIADDTLLFSSEIDAASTTLN